MAYVNLRGRARGRIDKKEASPKEGPKDNGNLINFLSPQEKAMANELILKKLLGYISVEDLVGCRLVNKVWSDVATRAFIPQAPVVQFWNFSSTSGMQVGPPNIFTETMADSRMIPCRKLSINGSMVKEPTNPEQKLIFPKFFEDVASFVIHLEIATGFHPIFPTVKPKDGLEYPNLKTLKLDIASRLTTDGLTSHVDAMIEILKHAPELDNISLKFQKAVPDIAFFRILENVPWPQIQHFTLRREMKDDDFQKLLEVVGKKLELKTFKFKIWFCYDPPRLGDHFYDFLESQRKTLETLKLEHDDICLKRGFQLPQMPKLKTLHIKVSASTVARLVALRQAITPIPHRYPNLRNISFYGTFWGDLEDLLQNEEDDMIPSETVTTLKLDHKVESHEHLGNAEEAMTKVRNTIRHAAQMFPGIKHLTVPANLRVLKAIDMEGAWGDVEELTLLCGHLGSVDMALTGYFGEEGELILKRGTRLLQTVEREAKRNRILNQVKVLRLEHTGDKAESCFTDMGCRLVLLKLENLECLDLRNHKPQEMSLSRLVVHRMQKKFSFL